MRTALKMTSLLIVAIFLASSFQSVQARTDSDYDGICDDDEIALNLDPENPDTDGDGINDLDDPTPKGSLINEEEVWDLERITVTTNRPVATFDETIVVNVSVGGASEADDITLMVYLSANDYSLSFVSSQQSALTNNRAVFEVTVDSPGKYYFAAVTDEAGLTVGNEATMSELNSLGKARRLSYVVMPCYYKHYATIDATYSNILAGHKGVFEVNHYTFSPRDDSRDFLARFAGSYDPRPALGLLYQRTPGRVHLGLNQEYSSDNLELDVGAKGFDWSYRFDSEGYMSVKASAYPLDKKWDYNFYNNYNSDSASLQVHDREVSWLTGPQTAEMGDTVEMTYFSYIFNDKMKAELFDSLFQSMGMVDMVKKFPRLSDPVRQTGTLALYYTGAGNYLCMDHVIGSVDGQLKLKYKVQVPGSYIALAGPGKVDSHLKKDRAYEQIPYGYYYDYYDGESEPPPGSRFTLSSGFQVRTDVRVNLHLDKPTYFPSDPVQVTTDVYDGGERPSDIKVRLHVSKQVEVDEWDWDWTCFETKEDFTDGKLGPYPQTEYRIKAVPMINAETRRVTDLVGSCELGGNWVASDSFDVQNLAIYAFMPREFPLSGQDTFRVIVHKAGNVPAQGIKVEMGPADDRRDTTPDTVYFSGTTDSDGRVSGIFKDSWLASWGYNLITAYAGAGPTAVTWGAGSATSETKLMVATSKPVYRPGDTVDVRVTALDTGTERPRTGTATVNLVDPYYSTTATGQCELNEYGAGACQLELPDFLAWGTYRISTNLGGAYGSQASIQVRYYETPEVYMEVEEEDGAVYEAGDTITVPVKVKYIQGEPVFGGKLNYTIRGQRYSYRSYWEPYGWEDDYYYYDGYDYDDDYYYEDWDRRSVSTRTSYRSYWGLKPVTEFELTGQKEVEDGEVSLKFTIPSRVAFLTLDLEYDDGYNNTAKLTHVINVGSQGETARGLRFELDKAEVSPDEDVTVTAAVDIYEDSEAAGHEPDVDMTLKVRAYDDYGHEHVLVDREINTGETGEYTATMSQLGVDLEEKFADRIFSYYVDLYVVNPELRLQLLDSATVQFMVYWQKFSASLPKDTYGPGEKVSVTLGTHDYETGDPVSGGWTIRAGPGSSGSSSYSYDYYDYYYSDYGGSGDFLVRSGKLSGSSKTVDFYLPSKLHDGPYHVTVDITDGEFTRSIPLQFQVSQTPPPKLDLKDCPDTFVPGETYKMKCKVLNAQVSRVYADFKTLAGITRKNIELDGSAGELELKMPVQLSPVTLGLSMIAPDGSLVTVTKEIRPVTKGLGLNITFDRDSYAPGDQITVSVTMEDEDGDPVEGAWISIGVVDKHVDLLEPHGNASSYYQAVMSSLMRTYAFNYISNYQTHRYTPADSMTREGEGYRYFPMLSQPSDPQDWYGREEDKAGEYDVMNLSKDFDSDGAPEPAMDAGGDGGDGAGGGSAQDMEEGGMGDDVFSTDPSLSSGAGSSIQTSVPQSAAELGGSMAGLLDNIAIREDGDDVAYFTAGMEAPEGTAVFDFTLPSAIATWKVEAAGHTRELAGTYAEEEFVVKRDFYVEADIPVRVVQDDELTITVNVFNFLDRAVGAQVGIVGDWFLAFDGNQKDVFAEARGITSAAFDVKITGSLEQNLTVAALEEGGLSDALLVPVTIIPNGALKTTHVTGALEGGESTEHDIGYKPESLEGAEKAVLRVAAGYEGLLDFYGNMYSYSSYSTNEAIASDLYRTCFRWDYYNARGWLDHWNRKWLTESINGTAKWPGILDRLEDAQRNSGAWGFWDDDPADVWLTAYTLGAVSKAEDLGFTRSAMRSAAVKWLKAQARDDGTYEGSDWLEGEDNALTAFVYYNLARVSLADVPSKTVSHLDSAFGDESLGDAYAVAMYALGRVQEGKSVQSQLSWLNNNKVVSHWEGPTSLGGADETTAWVAYLYAMNDYNKADIRGALEWLDMHRGGGGSRGSVTDTIAALHCIVELFEQNPYTSVTITISVDGTAVDTMYFGSSAHNYHTDKYRGIQTLDLYPYLKDGGSTLKVSVSGTGDVFYEVTTIQYLRSDVAVSFQSSVADEEHHMFDWTVDLDPGSSDNVWIEDVWIEFPYMDGLRLVSYDRVKPSGASTAHGFRFSFLAREAGEYVLEPLVVNYYFSAGERRSNLIRDYFGPVTFDIAGNATAGGLAETEIDVVKSAGDAIALTGEAFRVTVDLTIPPALQGLNFTVTDNVPDAFMVQTADGGVEESGRIVWEFNATVTEVHLDYLLLPADDFRGVMGSAVVSVDGAVCGISSSPAKETSSDDFLVRRSYDASQVNRNETLWVTLELYALRGLLNMPVVEDYMPTGFSAREDTFDLGEAKGSAMGDPDFPDKVVFSLTSVAEGESVTLRYGMRSTVPGKFSAPSALAYPARDIADVVYSPPGYVRVLKTWKNETGSRGGGGDPGVDAPAAAGGGGKTGEMSPPASGGTRTRAPAKISVYPTLELLDDRAAGKRVRGTIANDGETDMMVTAKFIYTGGEDHVELWVPANSVQTVQSKSHHDSTVKLQVADSAGNDLGSSEEWDFSVVEVPMAGLSTAIELEKVEMGGSQVVKVTGTLVNGGDKNVDTDVLFLMDGEPFYTRSLDAVPGLTRTITAYASVEEGAHTFTVIADPYSEHPEEDKQDNIASRDFDFQLTFSLETLLKNPFFIALVILAVVGSVLLVRKGVRKWILK